jgi:hypothetical protein
VSLRCSVCKKPVDEGLNFCPNCRTGFVSQLECVECGRLVARGLASCLGCPRSDTSPLPDRSLDVARHSPPTPPTVAALQPPSHAPPALPGLPPHVSLAAPVASRYVVRQGGVEAEVRVPPGDAEVMDLMGQVIVILHTFASKVNNLSGHGELTRHIIRSSRVLATDIQEELEQRRGPGR